MTNLKVNLATGLLESVPYHPSPHKDQRPDGVAIDMIVIHSISLPPGEFGTKDVEDFFLGELKVFSHPYFETIAQLKVSAHLFIKRTGETIQFVPFHERAWHAGESEFQGKSRCNDFSIGIELEGTDATLFELAQYQQLGKIVKLLMQSYPSIMPDRIVGHADIAPLRKTDPGALFDWAHLRGLIS